MDELDNSIDGMLGGSVYPTAGPTIAIAARPGASVSAGGSVPAAAGGVPSALPAGNFVVGMVTFLALLLVIMFVAHRFGGAESGDFKNVKASAYNVLFVALVAVVGIPVVKIGVVKLADMGVPLFDHAAAWVQAV